MLNFGLSILIGSVLGFLSALGTGGGSLLILWLTLVENTHIEDARAMNLLFFIPSAIIACLFHWKQGRLEIKKVLPAIVAGSISAGLFAWVSVSWDIQALRKMFGFLLLFTGLKELFYHEKV